MKANFFQRLRKATRYAFGIGIGYDATKNTRYREQKRIYGGIFTEDKELPLGDRLSMISILLDQRRNNPCVKAICRLREEDVIGGGLKPRPDTGDPVLDAELQSWWAEYATDCEVTGLSMMESQKLLASLTLIHGDGGLLLLEDGRVQLIAGEQIGVDTPSVFTPNATEDKDGIIEGVEIDSSGKPTGFYIGTLRGGERSKSELVSVADFIHHTKRMRIGQLRGVPELATAVDVLMDIEEYENIEMIAAKASASLSAAVKKESALDFELGSREEEDSRLEYFEPGRFHYLEPGEDVSVISPSGRPNVNAIDWLIYKLRKVGSTIGIPTEYLLMTIGETSFSASQGMVLLYQNTIEAEQRFMQQTMNRWWKWKLAHAISRKELTIKQEVNLSEVPWQSPAFRWINRSSQVQADSQYLQMGAMSIDQLCTQFGTTPEEVFTQKAKDISKAKQLAKQYDLDSWRDLMNPITTYGSFAYQPHEEPDDPVPVDTPTNTEQG
jgi:lambda family phage portal protein